MVAEPFESEDGTLGCGMVLTHAEGGDSQPCSAVLFLRSKTVSTRAASEQTSRVQR